MAAPRSIRTLPLLVSELTVNVPPSTVNVASDATVVSFRLSVAPVGSATLPPRGPLVPMVNPVLPGDPQCAAAQIDRAAAVNQRARLKKPAIEHQRATRRRPWLCGWTAP